MDRYPAAGNERGRCPVSIDEVTVRRVLNTITDPCSVASGVRAGIDELGLVREVRIAEGSSGARIHVRISPTDPGCLMIYPFANEARARLSALDGVDAVEVDLDVGDEWHPGDMSEDYRHRLENHRAARRQATGDTIGLGLDGRAHDPRRSPAVGGSSL